MIEKEQRPTANNSKFEYRGDMSRDSGATDNAILKHSFEAHTASELKVALEMYGILCMSN